MDIGSANVATGQQTTGAAQQLVAARATRRRIAITNHDATNPALVGPDSALSTGNGFRIKAGDTAYLATRAAIWSIAGAGTPVLSWIEEYD